MSFVVAMLSHYIGGTVIPYIITKEQQLEMIKQMYGQDYAMKMQELKTIPMMIIIAIAMVVVSFIGTYISKKFCKKHF